MLSLGGSQSLFFLHSTALFQVLIVAHEYYCNRCPSLPPFNSPNYHQSHLSKMQSDLPRIFRQNIKFKFLSWHTRILPVLVPTQQSSLILLALLLIISFAPAILNYLQFLTHRNLYLISTISVHVNHLYLECPFLPSFPFNTTQTSLPTKWLL